MSKASLPPVPDAPNETAKRRKVRPRPLTPSPSEMERGNADVGTRFIAPVVAPPLTPPHCGGEGKALGSVGMLPASDPVEDAESTRGTGAIDRAPTWSDAEESTVLSLLIAFLGRRWRVVLWVSGALTLAIVTAFHYLYFLPQLGKPTKFFLVDSVFEAAVAVLIALSAATIGARVLRMFPQSQLSRLERALIAYGLGTGGRALATAIIGLLHGYYMPVLLAELLVPLVIWRQDLARVVGALLPWQPRFVLAELQPRGSFESAIFAIVVTVAALIGEHTLVPFWGFDVFMYHFALPERFLALHELFGSPGIPQANLPYNNEMLNLLALNFQAEIGAGMLQAFFVGASCLAVFALGIRLLSRRVAWLGMAVFLVTPLVLYYTSSGLIDQQFAFMALLVILALLEYRTQRAPTWMILAGLLIGIGLGVKYQMAYLVLPMLVMVVWWSRPAQEGLNPLARKTNPSGLGYGGQNARATDLPLPISDGEGAGGWGQWFRAVAVNFILLGFCALDAFALWGLREWAQVGNPFFPLVWGGAEWSPQRMAFYVAQFDNFGSLHHSILGRIAPIFDWFWHWGRYDYTALPPLPVYFLAIFAPIRLLLPARTEAARRVRGSLALLLWLSLASLLLWGLVNQLVPRYVLPTFGLLALLAAAVMDGAVRGIGRWLAPRGRDLLCAVAAMVVLLPGVIFAIESRQANDPAPVYSGQTSYQAYIQTTQMWPSYWRTVDFFNAEVPITARVLGVNIAAGYFFHDPYLTPDMNRDTVVYLAQVAPTEAAKLAWLHAHGYSYLIYDRTVSLWSLARDPDNLLTPLVPSFEAFLNHQLILVASLDGTDVYMVPSGTVGTGSGI